MKCIQDLVDLKKCGISNRLLKAIRSLLVYGKHVAVTCGNSLDTSKSPSPRTVVLEHAPYSCDYNIVTKTVYYLNWNIFNGTNIAIIAHYGIIPNELKNQKHNTILLLSKFLDSNEDVCYQHYGIIYYSNGNSKTMKYAIKIRSTKCLQHK